MIQTFNAINGQSMYDVCLNTYGTLDLMYKLLQDNNIDNIGITPASGQAFLYDDGLVIDQGINQYFAAANVKYATTLNQQYDTVEYNPDFSLDFTA